jgi:hypothetical protein
MTGVRIRRDRRAAVAGALALVAAVAPVGGARAAHAATGVTMAVGGTYVADGPTRVLDTRHGIGTGGTKTPVQPGQTLVLQITNQYGQALASSAVVLNVTVTDAKGAGYLTVYADGQTAPTNSILNWNAGQTVANLVTAPTGTDGAVDFHNTGAATVDIVADQFGFFQPRTVVPVNPGSSERVFEGITGTTWNYTGCDTTSPGGWVVPGYDVSAGPDVQLNAYIADQAGWAYVQEYGDFTVTANGTATTYDGLATNASTTPERAYTYLLNPANGAYKWTAATSDATVTSAATTPCYFQVDGDTVISTPTVTPPSGTIHVGQTATFTVSATSTGTTAGKTVAYYMYVLNGTLGVGSGNPTVSATNGSAAITVTPGNWGTNTLSVEAVSASGHVSQVEQYNFYVAS